MQANGTGHSNDTRRAWEAPAMTVVAIGTETKSARKSEVAQADAGPKEPSPPAAPSTKLGLSFEMAFPLSARFQD